MAGSRGPSGASLQRFLNDSSTVDWNDFLTPRCYHKILDLNVAAHTADIIVKFDPGAGCPFSSPRGRDHRHDARRHAPRFDHRQ
jgi:hypothetical protein